MKKLKESNKPVSMIQKIFHDMEVQLRYMGATTESFNFQDTPYQELVEKRDETKIAKESANDVLVRKFGV